MTQNEVSLTEHVKWCQSTRRPLRINTNETKKKQKFVLIEKKFS